MNEHGDINKATVSDEDLKRNRRNSVVTALVLGVVALGIFVAFVGSAMLGH